MSNLFAFHVGDANPVSRHLHGRQLPQGARRHRRRVARAAQAGPPPEAVTDERAGRRVGWWVAILSLVFEKASTRTRCAFEVAAHEQGAHLTYLDPTGLSAGPQGVDPGHGTGARSHVRRDRVPRLRPVGGGAARCRIGNPGLERTDRPMASDAVSLRHAHDDRELFQGVPRRSRSLISATPATMSPTPWSSRGP